MYLARLLFTFGGTINRREWWVGTAAMLAALAITAVAVFAVCLLLDLRPNLTVTYLAVLAFYYPAAALMVKRVADIGWRHEVAFGLVALNVLLILQAFMMPLVGTLDNLLTLVVYALIAAEIVVCGFIKSKPDTILEPPALQAA